MNIAIQSLSNAAVFIDGSSMSARAEEIEFPWPKKNFTDYKALGLAGDGELPVGMAKLEASMKFPGFDQSAIMALSDYQTHMFQAMSSLEIYTSIGRTAELPVLLLMTGMVKEPGAAPFKAQARVEQTAKISVWHSELYVAGVQIMLYDWMSNMYIVGGVDQLANFRANLGG